MNTYWRPGAAYDLWLSETVSWHTGRDVAAISNDHYWIFSKGANVANGGTPLPEELQGPDNLDAAKRYVEVLVRLG